MKALEIRQMTSEEIEKKIKEGKSELLNMRMQSARGGLEKPHKISAMKKDIARMMTVLKERELGGKNENLSIKFGKFFFKISSNRYE